MKRKKKPKKKSERQLLIEDCEELLREQKFRMYGRACQFCGRTTQLGLFHILAKSTHPRIRLHEDNLLISCWFRCHHDFHHNPYYARDVIFPKIREICGENYEQELLELEKEQPKLTMGRIKEIYEQLKEEAL